VRNKANHLLHLTDVKYFIPIVVFLLAGVQATYAQMQRSTTIPSADGHSYIVVFPRGIQQSSGNVSYLLTPDTGLLTPPHPHAQPYIAPAAKPWLTVHGNVMYDFYYQSGVDTPYQQKDIYQHTVQTYLDITVKDQYPVRVGFTTSKGNSTLFRDITGVNLQYTNRDFKNMLLDKLQRYYETQLTERSKELQQQKAVLDAKIKQVNELSSWLSSPAQLQRLVEARERALYPHPKDTTLHLDSLPVLPDLNTAMRWKGSLQLPETPHADTSNNIEAEYTAKTKQLDSLQQQLSALDAAYRKNLNTQQGVDPMSKLMNTHSNKEFSDQLGTMSLPDSVLPKGYKNMLAIRSFGIGRTMADYSELTAKGISINGLQAEYNPSYYVAIATGVIDYRFRDYILNNGSQPKQYLNLVRFGEGMKEGNHLYFTYYFGQKQLYNLNTSDSTANQNNHIMGMSLEGRWQLAKTTFLTGEVAKSSLPYYQQEDGKGLFKFGDHSNEAYSVSATSVIPRSGTKLNANYKVMGASFQSFSLYTTGSAQTAWSVRVDQPFFKQQLLLSASVRKNDYTSQYQQADYGSNTVFKSLQATLRIKKWPVLTLGYFPSSQLTKLSDNSYLENVFYTLVGSLSHYYKYKSITMNTTLSYTRFYNRQTDSSFVYFNTKNILLNHAMFFGRLTVQGTASAALNSDYALYGADGNAMYKFNRWLDAGGGLKYSLQTVYDIRQLGYTGNLRLNIPKLGQIELMADKGFIPGAEKKLVSNNTGRITYTKIF
jgi:hypothetical protein